MKISIITINRNNKRGLKTTIESVVSQTYKHIEYIIIDGASTDGSVDVLNEYCSRFAFWISEQDNGIYNAMNKGLKYATGDYVLFVNSGDYLLNSFVIENIVQQSNNEDVVYGNIGIYQNGKLKEIKSSNEIYFYKRYQHNLPPHLATFIKRNILIKFGGFDESYNVISDVILISRIFYSEKINYKFIDLFVTVFDLNGISSKKANQKMIYEERKKFILKEYPHYFKDLEEIYYPNIYKRISTKLKSIFN